MASRRSAIALAAVALIIGSSEAAQAVTAAKNSSGMFCFPILDRRSITMHIISILQRHEPYHRLCSRQQGWLRHGRYQEDGH